MCGNVLIKMKNVEKSGVRCWVPIDVMIEMTIDNCAKLCCVDCNINWALFVEKLKRSDGQNRGNIFNLTYISVFHFQSWLKNTKILSHHLIFKFGFRVCVFLYLVRKRRHPYQMFCWRTYSCTTLFNIPHSLHTYHFHFSLSFSTFVYIKNWSPHNSQTFKVSLVDERSLRRGFCGDDS